MKNIQERLFQLQDKEYAKFQAKLTPGIDEKTIIGVRVPQLRKLARDILREDGYEGFLLELPHDYYDENLLHGLIISEIKDYDKCIFELDRFLPFIDNWAVCDITSPKVFKKNKESLIKKIYEWSGNSHTYTCRFGIEMLMSHFLDEDFREEYLEIPAGVQSEEYYVRMMVAWYFATALAKQWDATVPYIEKKKLEIWTHNKAIQKARESLRITKEQKEYLNSFKIK